MLDNVLVFICSGCHKENNIDGVAYKKLTFISHGSGGREVQGHGVNRVRVRVRAHFLTDGYLLTGTSPG